MLDVEWMFRAWELSRKECAAVPIETWIVVTHEESIDQLGMTLNVITLGPEADAREDVGELSLRT